MAGFGRHQRLSSKQDFTRTFAKGMKIKTKHFTARFIKTAHEYPRIGILVPKSIVKKAVTRNLIRRIVRESFRHNQQLIKELDIIVLLHTEWTAQKHLLRTEVDKLWEQLAISCVAS